ncbi:hypothetical protein DFH27DRAFT_509922 [Peziza echinospora]|nr:hypothetical protein DFH27DRAFT_509922 [Peziza echinospora]
MDDLEYQHQQAQQLAAAAALDHGATGFNTFPLTEEDFRTDPRVSFSRISAKWTLEADDGSEYEYDEALRRWIPVLDESLLEKQQAAYAVAGVDESEPVQLKNKKKRKVYTSNDPAEQEPATTNAKKSKPGAGGEPKEKKNTSIYITNLPLDATVAEINTVFSKCGVISEEIDRGKPRIKLYTDENGNPKGDCLVVYFRAESVGLAIQMLDGTDLRFGMPDPRGPMKVEAADFSYKKVEGGAGGEGGGQTEKKKNMKEKKKVIAKTQKLNNKLADWDDDDPASIPAINPKFEKTVILKHMFTLKELEENPTAILDIKEDIREECAALGDVTNVILYDLEADGVVAVRFANPESARACVQLMDGRFFDGVRVEAYIFDGAEKFRKTSTKAADEDAAAAEEKRRLERFGDWLEAGAGEGAGAGEEGEE